ncbi:hypothetical protein E5S67_00699 [Microcoleus sp. IPMA8]|uniref:Uncharacterized protein n=1 Tax=Microcoleus asticus IPMA8 TaxID=2563858 RepID=A0ABX2CRE8_9CYAN|nr:hypothetical protein [Microcoleus asticus IPMA8]
MPFPYLRGNGNAVSLSHRILAWKRQCGHGNAVSLQTSTKTVNNIDRTIRTT